MTPSKTQALVDRGSLFFIAAMSFIWSGPLATFWIEVLRHNWFPSIPFCIVWGTLSTIPFLLPSTYYRPQNFEADGRLYEALGVRRYKRWVTHGDRMNQVIRRNDPTYRVLRNPQSIRDFSKQADQSERWHLAFLIVSTATSFHAIFIGWYRWSLYLMLANALVNLYPILLQRYSRSRLSHLRGRWSLG